MQALAAIAGGLMAADVGEIALIADVGGQIQDAVALPNRYLERAACAFYGSHGDQYDALFIYTTFPLNMLTRVQQGWPTRAAAMGIGRDLYFDTTSRFCAARVRHVVKMGDIQSFDDDPDAIYTGIFGFTMSGVELMGHEFGHQWGASITYDRGDGARRCLVRGFNDPGEPPMNMDCDGYRNSDFNQHWSYYLNSGSVMYGNTIEDLGGGQFRISNPATKFSELDQYLMGLRDPSEVAPMFLVSSDLFGTASFPIARDRSETIGGERVDFTIEDVIRAEGPRVPARDMCHWKAAFMIVHEDGTPPSAQEIARVDAYRRRWEGFYADATDRRGSFDTTLAGQGPGTVECPSMNDPPPPPPDAGFADAAGSFEDAGFEDDAGAPVSPDAAVIVPPPPPPAEQNDDPKTLVVDDCACTTTERGEALWVVSLLALVARRRSRNHRDP